MRRFNRSSRRLPIGESAAVMPQVGVAKFVEPANRLLGGGSSELRAIDRDLGGRVRKHCSRVSVNVRDW